VAFVAPKQNTFAAAANFTHDALLPKPHPKHQAFEIALIRLVSPFNRMTS
jgi:hypothetical protein